MLRLAKVEVDDTEVICVVLGSTTDAIASVAGSTLEWPLRNLHRRLTKRLVRRREKLIAETRERLEFLPEQDCVARGRAGGVARSTLSWRSRGASSRR